MNAISTTIVAPGTRLNISPDWLRRQGVPVELGRIEGLDSLRIEAIHHHTANGSLAFSSERLAQFADKDGPYPLLDALDYDAYHGAYGAIHHALWALFTDRLAFRLTFDCPRPLTLRNTACTAFATFVAMAWDPEDDSISLQDDAGKWHDLTDLDEGYSNAVALIGEILYSMALPHLHRMPA